MSTEQTGAAANELLRTMICHRTTLVSVARRILQSRELAEDVVQDAALKACQMDGELRLDCPLRFSCSVVRNLAIDRARRSALEQRHAAPLPQAEEAAAAFDDPLRTLEGRELLAKVMLALQELPERTRLAFALHRFHDVPQKTIAASLGVSTTLVNFMIRRAQEHCRMRLDDATPPRAVTPAPHPAAGMYPLRPKRAQPGEGQPSSKRSGTTPAALHAASRFPSGNAHSLI